MASLTLLFVGRAKAGSERDLADRYVARATAAARPLGFAVVLREISESPARSTEARQFDEARALRANLPGAAVVIALDERGPSMTSTGFAALLRRLLDEGRSPTLVIGGPDGLDPAFRQEAAHLVAFGAMTWPHQLVRIMAAEQIYRAVTILSGHPYHRA